MATERREGQPFVTLFPLKDEALMTASCALRDATQTEDIDEVRKHFEEVFSRPYVLPNIKHFFGQRYDEMPELGGVKNYYVFGVVISLDAIGVQSALEGMRVVHTRQDDIEAYKIIRRQLVGLRWFEASDDVLELLERKLSHLLRDADSAYNQAAQEVEEQERDRDGLVQNISFLLGLCDFYFPFRYADERVRIMMAAE